MVPAGPAVSSLGWGEMLTYLLRVSRTRRAPAARSAPVLTSVPPAVPAGPGRNCSSRTLEDVFAAEIAAGRKTGDKPNQTRTCRGRGTPRKHQESPCAL